jgi:hypothetical protein
MKRSCETCGATFDARPAHVRRGWGRFCSIACRDLPLAERFARRIDRDGPLPPHRPDLGPCHLWTGARDERGYGTIKADGTNVGVHRVAFFLARGRWPEPCALHHCDNPACVRPEHLFEGDVAANNADRERKGRTVVPRLQGFSHGMAKLTSEQVEEIRAACRRGELQKVIAERFGIGQQHVSRIRLRQTRLIA